jgi:hypothetical protein
MDAPASLGGVVDSAGSDERGRVAPCAEYPNDNPALHCGAIWFCAEVGAQPVCERRSAPATEGAHGTPQSQTAQARPEAPASFDADEDDPGDIEIVDDLSFDDAIDEPGRPQADPIESLPAEPSGDSRPPDEDDAFAALVRALEEVAMATGAGESAMALLRVLTGRARRDSTAELDTAGATDLDTWRGQALAWQAILRGESDDFGACGGAMLDDWCAALLAFVIRSPARTDGLKRDLRRRGVAAFGIVTAAA